MKNIPAVPYAKAIFESSKSSGALEFVCADFKLLLTCLKESQDLSAFVRTRSLDVSRAQTLEKIFKDAIHPLTLKFLNFLASKDRLEILEDVAQEFLNLYRREKGITVLEVTSYGALDEKILADIKDKWSCRLNQQIEMNVNIDRSILGGVKFKIEDEVFDYSIQSQFERLHEQLVK